MPTPLKNVPTVRPSPRRTIPICVALALRRRFFPGEAAERGGVRSCAGDLPAAREVGP